MSKEHPDRCCPEHTRARLRIAFNPKGGTFNACPVEGCRYTWSDRDQRYFGPGLTVSAAGMRHRTLLNLIGTHRLSIAEAQAMIDSGDDIRDVYELSNAAE